MSLLKATVLSVGLLGATVLAAQAQSVSSVPPTGPVTSAAPAPIVSTQRIVPEPGGSVNIRAEHFQSSANTASTLVDHPYSGSVDHKAAGPKAN